MPGRRLRLGVIGAGSWATAAHLPALALREEVDFVAVSRLGGDALGRVQRRFGFALASEDYRDVLAAGVDIVVVASPSFLHREQAGAALEAGAHVLCEKPMTVDPVQAWELVDLSQRVGRSLLLSFGWNFMPIVRDAKALLVRHGIGRLEQLSVTMGSTTRELLTNTGAYPDAAMDAAPDPATWTDPAQSGGGYGQAQLTHGLGLALHLTGARAEGAFALMAAPSGGPVELHDAITLSFEGGAIGTVAGSSTHAGAAGDKHQLDVRLVGSEGQLLIDVFREMVWLYRPDGDSHQLPLGPGAGSYQAAGPANALVDIALGVADNDCAPGELGARTTEALAAAYRSARTGRFERR